MAPFLAPVTLVANITANATGSSILTPFFEGNAAWAADINAKTPDFLPTLAKAQAPPLLWVGCGDSRVPESVIMDQLPGQVFTHRNIANQIHVNDSNSNAVIEYGVLHLNITQVAIVGHTNCGGVKAAQEAALAIINSNSTEEPDQCGGDKPHAKRADAAADSPLSQFLAPLINLRVTELPANATIEELTIANVKRSVENVANSDAIAQAWAAGMNVSIHGWLYNLTSGVITDLHLSKHNVA